MSELFTGRLIRLRAAEPADAPTLFQFRNDTELTRHEGRLGWPTTLNAIEADIQRKREGDNAHLIIETINGVLVGELNIQVARPRHGTFEMGISLGDRTAWGRGYAKEACLLALHHMFHERRYHKCNVGLFAFNERSLRLFQALGFIEEGRVRENYYTDGIHYDEIWLGLLRTEFEANM